MIVGLVAALSAAFALLVILLLRAGFRAVLRRNAGPILTRGERRLILAVAAVLAGLAAVYLAVILNV